jgi:hypothetical protein
MEKRVVPVRVHQEVQAYQRRGQTQVRGWSSNQVQQPAQAGADQQHSTDRHAAAGIPHPHAGDHEQEPDHDMRQADDLHGAGENPIAESRHAKYGLLNGCQQIKGADQEDRGQHRTHETAYGACAPQRLGRTGLDHPGS